MATEKLVAVIDADTRGLLRGIHRSNLEVAKMSGKMARMGKRIDRSTASMRRLAQGIAGVVVGYVGIRKAAAAARRAIGVGKDVLFAAASYETLRARLTQILGTQDAANAKFTELQQLAASTPFQLEDIADAFIRLKAAGFDIDLEKFRSLGDVAAASNKPLAELADAMISAGRGQAAMVDNFVGLAGKAEKGALTLTNAFTGVRKEGVATKDGILEFFVAAGKAKEVEGAMDRLSKTATGKLSTMGDAFKAAKATVGDVFLPAFKTAIDGVSTKVQGITPRLKRMAESIMAGFTPRAMEDFRVALEPVSGLFSDTIDSMIAKAEEFGGSIPALAASLREAFTPENVANFRDIVAELGAGIAAVGKVMKFIASIPAALVFVGAAIGKVMDQAAEALSDVLALLPFSHPGADPRRGLLKPLGPAPVMRDDFRDLGIGKGGFIAGTLGDESAVLRTILDIFDKRLMPVLEGAQ